MSNSIPDRGNLPPLWRAAASAAANAAQDRRELKGLGGWLILVALFLGWTAVEANVNFLQIFVGDFDISGWPGGASFFLFLLFIADLTINAGGAGALLFLFFRKSARFPFLFQAWVAGALAWWLTSSVLLLFLWIAVHGSIAKAGLSLMEAFDFPMLGTLMQGAVIWLPYIRKSVRVRNTFVQGSAS